MNFIVISGAALALTILTASSKKELQPNASSIISSSKTSGTKDIGLPRYQDYDYNVVVAKGETENDDEETQGPEYVNPTLEYKSIATDMVNKWFLATKVNVYHFLKLVVATFTNAISQYCEQHSIDPERIRFVYKGGNVLRIVANEFILELPGHASDIIDEFYGQYFKRTDADFSIYIDPSLPSFTRVLDDLTVLSWMLQRGIRDQINANRELYFEYYRLNAHVKSQFLDEFLAMLRASSSITDSTNAMFYRGKFEGVSFDGLSALTVDSVSSPDLFITRSAHEGIVSFSTDDIDQIFRIQTNTALDFGSGTNRASFNLIRTKVMFQARFVDINGSSKTHIFGGELLDVSIPKPADGVLAKFFKSGGIISRYELKLAGNDEENIIFFAYTLGALIADLDHILFEFNKHPWDDNKYVKRLNRLFYLCFVDLFVNVGNNDSRREYMRKWATQFSSRTNVKPSVKPSAKTLAFDKFAKRALAAAQPVTSTRHVEYMEFIEQIQKNCVVVLTALKNVGTFCSDEWTISKSSLQQANLNALIRGD